MPSPIQRLRYFDHQLLGVTEFADEQQYHMDMRRLHNRLLHTWGIADGLELRYGAASQRLTVEEGTALDASGREIVLQQQRDLDVAAFDGQTVWVTLAYGEVQTAPVTDGQATDYGRWEEAPRLELSATRPADSGQQLVLGRVHVNAAGESKVDDGEGSFRRRQAGSKAGDIEVRAITLAGGSEPEGWPSLRMTGAKAASLTGALTVEGALAAAGDLDVQGSATVAQSVGIGGKPQARLHVQTPPQEAGGNAVLVGPAEGTSLRLGYNVGYGWIQSRDGGLRLNDAGGDVLLVPGAGGSVGIGTAQPLQRLHVVGDDAVGLFESRGSAASLSLGTREGEANRAGIAARPGGRLALWTQAGDDVVNVTRDGRVGMGTENPTHRFHVRADDPVALFESIGAQAYLRIATREGMENRVELVNRPGGRLALWTAGGGDALSITREGSVGIGTDRPTARLHVAGDLVVDGEIRSAAGTAVGGGGGAPWGGASPWQPVTAGLGYAGSVGVGTLTPEARLQVVNTPQGSGGDTLILGPIGGSNLRLGYSDAYSWIQSHGSKPLRLNELGNDVLIAPGANANVGIGTSAPTSRLHVVGDLMVEGVIRTPQGALTPGGGGGAPSPAPAGSSAGWTDTANGGIARAQGNVGIGTAEPNHALHVRADGAVGLFESSSNNAFLRVSTSDGIDNRVELCNRGGGRLALWVAGAGDALNIVKEGRVGIGTPTPQASLHVVGDLLVEGKIRTTAGDVVPGGAAAGTASPWGAVGGGISYRGGRVGIGTDNLPQQLNVTEGIGFANQNAADKRLWSPADGLLRWQTHNAAGEHAFEVGHQGDAAAVHLNTNGPSWFVGGMVGVGTPTPSHTLHVRAEGAVGLFESSSNNAFLRVATSDGIDNRVELCNRGDGRLALWVAGAGDAVNVLKDGRVGINTAAPEGKLQVVNAPTDSNGATLVVGPITGPNLRLGYAGDYSWMQSHGSKPLRINELGNDVVINRTGGRTGVGIDPQARLHVNGQITAGPYAWAEAVGRVEATGPAGELSFARRDLTAPRSNAGDRYVWYNQDGIARLWTEGVGNLISVDSAGKLEVADLNIRSGRKPGFVYDHFVNETGDDVEQGDVVVIGESDATRFWATGNAIPIPEVDLCDRAYDTRVCGIVDSVTRAGELPFAEAAEATGRRRKKPAAEDAAHPLQSLAADDDAVAATVGEGQLGRMVTLGAYAFCKVDADLAPIRAGDLLTTSPTKGHAQKVLDRGQAGGAIIGKALASLSTGKGKIPVMVLMQ